MQKHWVWLATRSGIGVRGRAELLRRFGTAERIYAMDRDALQAEEGLRRSWLEPLLDKTLDGAERILAQCDRFDIRLLTYAEPAYPERLRSFRPFSARRPARRGKRDRHIFLPWSPAAAAPETLPRAGGRRWRAPSIFR